MKVLVTGHHGYIGSVVAPLVADAERVYLVGVKRVYGLEER